MPDAHPNPLDLTHLKELLDRTRTEPQAVTEEATALLGQAREAGDREAEHMLLVVLATAQIDLGQAASARQIFTEALTVAGEHPEMRARTFKQRLRLLVDHCDDLTGQDDYAALSELLPAFTDSVELISALNILAGVTYFRDDVPGTIQWSQQARQVALDTQDMGSVAKVAGNMAVLYSDTGQFSLALKHARESVQYSTPQNRTVAVLQAVTTYMAVDQYQAAIALIDEYFLDSGRTAATYYEKYLIVNKSECLSQLKMYLESASLTEEYQIHTDANPRLRTHALDTLGTAMRHLKQPEKSRTYLTESLRLFRELQQRLDSANPLVGLAELELDHDVSLALSYGRQALEALEEESTNPRLWSRALHVLSRGHAALGEFREAYEFGEQHRALQARLDREAEQQRLDVAFAELEVERTQAVAEIQRTALGQARGEVAALHAHLESRVEQRTRELQAANEELSAFAWSLSHYLRTPMQLVMGHADLLVSVPEAERAAHAEGIMQSIGRMSEMLDGLLRYAERHLKPLESRPVAVGDLVDQAWTELALGDGVQLVVNPLPVVVGDPAALRLVFRNLLANAAQHSRGREGARVVVRAGLEGGMHVIEVQDNGVGFDPGAAQRLFRVFSQLPAGQSFEGLGLGLADVWRVVIAHGGHVRTEGRPGEGASFFVYLPATPELVLGAPASA
ncbi:sensor histidine kinase [Deinococcus knuensis]|uniref:histidine kinase n=1 Tax=Deinococcus knuensis TaxID=1837380 RepID=A0ABQ2SHU7_9DEIO|nr:ATP-binding protein [Deinococcus knuensis]GGS30049.1 hypothetical protein GCM10008961_22100 [Deinococcus knuensis]